MVSLTDEYCGAWKSMGITKEWKIKRISDWANMLESRLSELDPNYRSYQFGRVYVGDVIANDNISHIQIYQLK